MTSAEGLRCFYRHVIAEFDSKKGNFENIEYTSPWVLASGEWQQRTGYTQNQLENIITEQRRSFLCADPLSPDIKSGVSDFRNAVAEWRRETGYADPPFKADIGPYDKALTKRLRDFVWKRWLALGLRDPEFRYVDRALEFSGFFEDKFGHTVALRFYVDRVGGYRLGGRFRFPYFGLEMPKALDLDTLLGVSFARLLGFPPETLVRKASEIDNLLSVDEITSIISVIKRIIEPLKQ